MESRRAFIKKGKENTAALEGIERGICGAFPIVSAGDVAGAVVFLEKGENSRLNESDIKLGSVAAGFLGNQVRI
jgi:AbrB family transcriptional regulator (stage V sporulation protein T)